MRPAQRLLRILAQPIAELPESPDGPVRRPGRPVSDDASGSRYQEEPFTVDPALPGDKAKPSFLSDGKWAARHASVSRKAAGSEPEILDVIHTRDGRITLGYHPKGESGTYPPARYYVKLPSGLNHWFETEDAARQSQYWPRVPRQASVPRRAFDQPRLDGGDTEEPIHTLTEDGDSETRSTDRLSGLPRMHAWRCAECHTAVRTARCMCPTRCPGCGGTHLRADVTRERGKTREGGPTETAYRQSMGEHDLEAPLSTPSVP